MTVDPAYMSVLRKIHNRLSSTDVNWAVTGSMGFALQGVPVKPNDIDIQTGRRGAFEMERIFSTYVVKPVRFSSTERIRSYFGILMIDGIKVEIMGDVQKKLKDGTWEEPVDVTKYRRIVEVEGMKIPVLSLEYEYQAYLKLGRVERAELLKKWIQCD